jgi:hypothetical protein
VVNFQGKELRFFQKDSWENSPREVNFNEMFDCCGIALER